MRKTWVALLTFFTSATTPYWALAQISPGLPPPVPPQGTVAPRGAVTPLPHPTRLGPASPLPAPTPMRLPGNTSVPGTSTLPGIFVSPSPVGSASPVMTPRFQDLTRPLPTSSLDQRGFQKGPQQGTVTGEIPGVQIDAMRPLRGFAADPANLSTWNQSYIGVQVTIPIPPETPPSPMMPAPSPTTSPEPRSAPAANPPPQAWAGQITPKSIL